MQCNGDTLLNVPVFKLRHTDRSTWGQVRGVYGEGGCGRKTTIKIEPKQMCITKFSILKII